MTILVWGGRLRGTTGSRICRFELRGMDTLRCRFLVWGQKSYYEQEWRSDYATGGGDAGAAPRFVLAAWRWCVCSQRKELTFLFYNYLLILCTKRRGNITLSMCQIYTIYNVCIIRNNLDTNIFHLYINYIQFIYHSIPFYTIYKPLYTIVYNFYKIKYSLFYNYIHIFFVSHNI